MVSDTLSPLEAEEEAASNMFTLSQKHAIIIKTAFLQNKNEGLIYYVKSFK